MDKIVTIYGVDLKVVSEYSDVLLTFMQDLPEHIKKHLKYDQSQVYTYGTVTYGTVTVVEKGGN